MSSKYILLVEDDPTQVKISKKIIGQFNYDITCLQKGSEVIQFLKGEKTIEGFPKEKLGLILLDLNLNKVSGFDILKQMQESGENIPIIVISASDETPMILEAGRLGAKDYIVKGKEEEMRRMFFKIDEFMKEYL